jgi:hypothetical protein
MTGVFSCSWLFTAGRAKALEANTVKARPKISFEVFMVIAPDRLSGVLTRYGGNATPLEFIKKSMRLVPIIAEIDSCNSGVWLLWRGQ